MPLFKIYDKKGNHYFRNACSPRQAIARFQSKFKKAIQDLMVKDEITNVYHKLDLSEHRSILWS